MARPLTPTRRRAARPVPSSPLARWATRLVSVLGGPVICPIRARRTRRLARWNIDTAKRWRRKRINLRVLELVTYLGAVLLLVGVAASAYVMVSGSPGLLAGLNLRCGAYSQACGTFFGCVPPLLSLARASPAAQSSRVPN